MAHPTRCLVLTGGLAADGPYGIDRLPELGYELLEVRPASGRLHTKLRDVVEHRSGMPWDKTLRSIPQAWRSDLVLAFLERQALTAAAFKRHGLPPYAGRPLAMVSCWLADELRAMDAAARRRIVASYEGVDLTLVLSENQVDVMVDAGFREGSVEAVSFGYAPSQFPHASASGRTRPVVAVGFDRGRDYATLVEAVRGTGIPVDLYCHPGNIEGIDLPPEITFHGVVPFGEYRQVVASAQVVAVPTREMTYPSGQSVALEAGATGACLVITNTPALREYVSEGTALLCPPGNAGAWRAALTLATRDPGLRAELGEAAASDFSSRFTYLQMWQQIDALFRARGWSRE